MGTRSVVAVPAGDSWRGRYCHWDGYPSGVGYSLLEIVLRDGREQAIKVLTEEHASWSVIDGQGSGSLSGAKVEGYGAAHTDVPQPEWDTHWILPDGDDWGTEWCYVLAVPGMVVLERRRGTNPESDEGHMVGMFGVGAGTNGHWKLRGEIPWPTNDVELTAASVRLEEIQSSR